MLVDGPCAIYLVFDNCRYSDIGAHYSNSKINVTNIYIFFLQDMLAAAQKVFDEVNSSGKPLPSTGDHTSYLDEEAESMRWFLLSSEAEQVLLGVATPTTTPPFQPRHYPSPEAQNIMPNSVGNTSPTETISLWKSKPRDIKTANGVTEQCELNKEELRETEKKGEIVKFHCPPKNIYKPTTEVLPGC